nr:hypothetical protein [uncultured Blautia sp.]
MREKRVRNLIINGFLIVLISLLYWQTSIIQKNHVNKVSYIFIITFFGLAWFIPGGLRMMSLKRHFVECVSAMISFMFQMVFWSNTVLIFTHFAEYKIRFGLNIVFLCLTVVFFCIIVKFETKSKSGIPTKKEIKNIEKALLELELACSFETEIDQSELEEIKDELNLILKMKKSFVHGIDQNLLDECRIIRNAALCKDKDTIMLHASMLRQLVLISKQKI